jgi:hypothetical protein
VGEHWDGEAAVRGAVRVAQLAAGLAALADGADPGAPGPAASADVPGAPDAGASRWRRSGLVAEADRWPA